MFAYVILSYLHFRSSAKRNPDFIDDFTEIDFGVFEYFECQPQESELDSLFADSIKKIIIENSKIHAIYDVSIPSLYFDNLLTLENYRKFYAMIQRYTSPFLPLFPPFFPFLLPLHLLSSPPSSFLLSLPLVITEFI